MDRSNYIIRVRGRLDEQWSGWFEGMRISLEDDGTTVLSGYLEDQAALFGVLKKKDLETIKELIDAKVIKGVVDRSFPMDEASKAQRYAGQGERKGPVVIVMKREGEIDGK